MYKGELKAKIYPFQLDSFQVKSVRAIESDENVLVCAHTSAGKTAIA
jgi:superfamily II RNA helicase